MFNFKGYIFNKFPLRVKETDPNKDTQDRGTWERYVSIFESEIDEELYPFIRDFMNIFDAAKTDEKFLPYLAHYLGSPPSVNDDITTYRKILSYATQLYRIKGTKKSFELLFKMYGLDVTVKEAEPKRAANYDQGLIYDSATVDEPMVTYDQQCEECVCFNITYAPIGDTANNTEEQNLTVPSDMMELINKILCFLIPINSKLCGVYRKLAFEDEFLLNLQDTPPAFIIADRIRFMQIFPDYSNPTYAQLVQTYETENMRELDLDQIYDDAVAMGVPSAQFFFANETEIVSSFVVHNLPISDKSSFVSFIKNRFYNVTQNESLEETPDYLYILNPEGPNAYYGMHLIPMADMLSITIRIKDTNGANHPDCPTLTFPVRVYGVDGIIAGIANTPEEIAEVWNNYVPNKERGYLDATLISGCEYTVKYHPSAEPPVGITVDYPPAVDPTDPDEPGDFNDDFGDDFYN